MGFQTLHPLLRAFMRLCRGSRWPQQQRLQQTQRQRQSRQMASASTSAILYAVTVAAPTLPSHRPDNETTATKAHHRKEGGFQNPWPSYRHLSGADFGMAFLRKRWNGDRKVPDTSNHGISVQHPAFLPTRETSKLRATWLGHACFLVEFPSGLRVLFDPVFEERCSPFSFLGPKRYTPAPCAIVDIPFIDAVFISHNHYDHLSYPTTQQIKQHHPNAHFFVPLGNKKWFHDSGITNVTELDWWDEVDLTLQSGSTPASSLAAPSSRGSEKATPTATPAPPVSNSASSASSSSSSPSSIYARIACLPSQHHSARGLTDRGETLWASWAIRSGQMASAISSTAPRPTPGEIKQWPSVYFAGDTGYGSIPLPHENPLPDQTATDICPAFAEIGIHQGPFNLGLIPIGAYEPRSLFSSLHADPRDAVNIFTDTRCERAIGMHWGTWVLTEEDVKDPPERLRKAMLANRHGEGEGVFGVLGIGESQEI